MDKKKQAFKGSIGVDAKLLEQLKEIWTTTMVEGCLGKAIGLHDLPSYMTWEIEPRFQIFTNVLAIKDLKNKNPEYMFSDAVRKYKKDYPPEEVNSYEKSIADHPENPRLRSNRILAIDEAPSYPRWNEAIINSSTGELTTGSVQSATDSLNTLFGTSITVNVSGTDE